jgi:large subunit ribosomal protein L25
MSEITTLSANGRDRAGKGGARATRREGLVPAVIYGNKQPPLSIALDPRRLWVEMNRPGLHSRLFDVAVEGTVERVLCRDIQRHKVSGQPLHVDFLRVSAESKVHVRVVVHFINQDQSPGLKKGGVLNVVAHELEIIAPATAIPSALTVDLSGLEIGASIHLSAVVLPEGVTAASHEKGATVATIAAPTVAQTAGEAATAGEGVTPAAS